jgi:hypothetical protein
MGILITGNNKKSSHNRQKEIFFTAGEPDWLHGAPLSGNTVPCDRMNPFVNILDKIPAMKLITIISLQ